MNTKPGGFQKILKNKTISFLKAAVPLQCDGIRYSLTGTEGTTDAGYDRLPLCFETDLGRIPAD
jgi:hypothetical protein